MQPLFTLSKHWACPYAAWDGEGKQLSPPTEVVWPKCGMPRRAERFILRGHLDLGQLAAAWSGKVDRHRGCRTVKASCGRRDGHGAVHPFGGHSGWVKVNHAAWDGEGKRIVTASDDGSAIVWDVETSAVVHLSGHGCSKHGGRGVRHAAWDGEGVDRHRR